MRELTSSIAVNVTTGSATIAFHGEALEVPEPDCGRGLGQQPAFWFDPGGTKIRAAYPWALRAHSLRQMPAPMSASAFGTGHRNRRRATSLCAGNPTRKYSRCPLN